MTIQSLSSKTNSLVLPSKSTENGKIKNADTQATEKPEDSLAMTAAAKEIIKTFDSSSAVNKERVSAIKTALENGSYQINADQIATKMTQMENDQFNSR